MIPGKSNPHAVTGEVSFLKALEYTLGNGSSLRNPDYHPGIDCGPLENLCTYTQFYDAVIKQIESLLDITCSKIKRSRDYIADNGLNCCPYKSLLTEGCLESEKDFNAGGANGRTKHTCL